SAQGATPRSPPPSSTTGRFASAISNDILQGRESPSGSPGVLLQMNIELNSVKFDEQGLIPGIVQDVLSGEVLMMAWANRESLEMTASTGDMTFWSRSRKELWRKGATSGNTMKVLELRADCDGDALLALVEPSGPACHTGERSCFFNV